jgi:hypothetical protein
LAIHTLEIGGVKESLPSQRRMFWEYNLMYYSPELKKVPAYAADNDIELAYLLPMLWDEDVPVSYSGGVEIASPADSCREYRILHDPVSWPYMKYGNNWYDIDPLYNDPMIYSVSDSAGQHILGFYRKVFWEEPGAPEVAALPCYNWDIDRYNGYAPDREPVTWPRFDGSYTNPDLLTASQESLPLGDLNWFPEQKFKWYANREMIREHVLDLKEDKYQLQEPDSIRYRVRLTILDIDSSPIEGATLILDGDTLGLTDEAGVIEFDTLSGSYPFVIKVVPYEEVRDTITLFYSGVSKTIKLRYAVGSEPRPASEILVMLYPNPVSETVLVAGKHIEGAAFQIVGMNGVVYRNAVLSADRTRINLGGLPDGLYVIHIWKGRRKFTGRIMIMKNQTSF